MAVCLERRASLSTMSKPSGSTVVLFTSFLYFLINVFIAISMASAWLAPLSVKKFNARININSFMTMSAHSTNSSNNKASNTIYRPGTDLLNSNLEPSYLSRQGETFPRLAKDANYASVSERSCLSTVNCTAPVVVDI